MHIDIQHIARLAKLRIPEGRQAALAAEMQAIVKMVEHLPPLADDSLLEQDNTMQLRTDEVRPSTPRDEILQNAPKKSGGCFRVPKTVE